MELVPDFDEHGVLPDGVHKCDEKGFKQRFVDEFPASETRPRLRQGFRALREEVVKHGPPGVQWVDGSFVTTKLNPGDIDIVTFMDLERLNALSRDNQAAVERLVKGRECTKAAYGCHTFLVPSCEPNHPFFPKFEQRRRYWRKWFGKTRPGRSKGFVAMALGDEEGIPEVSAEREPQ